MVLLLAFHPMHDQAFALIIEVQLAAMAPDQTEEGAMEQQVVVIEGSAKTVAAALAAVEATVTIVLAATPIAKVMVVQVVGILAKELAIRLAVSDRTMGLEVAVASAKAMVVRIVAKQLAIFQPCWWQTTAFRLCMVLLRFMVSPMR